MVCCLSTALRNYVKNFHYKRQARLAVQGPLSKPIAVLDPWLNEDTQLNNGNGIVTAWSGVHYRTMEDAHASGKCDKFVLKHDWQYDKMVRATLSPISSVLLCKSCSPPTLLSIFVPEKEALTLIIPYIYGRTGWSEYINLPVKHGVSFGHQKMRQIRLETSLVHNKYNELLELQRHLFPWKALGKFSQTAERNKNKGKRSCSMIRHQRKCPRNVLW